MARHIKFEAESYPGKNDKCGTEPQIDYFAQGKLFQSSVSLFSLVNLCLFPFSSLVIATTFLHFAQKKRFPYDEG